MDKQATLEKEIKVLRKHIEEIAGNRSQQLLDIAGTMFIAMDSDGYVTLANNKAAQVLGFPIQEIIGKNWFDHFLPKQNLEEVREVFRKIMSENLEPVEYYENPVINKNGEELIIAWHNSILRNEKNELIGILSSGDDITQRIRAEQDLKSKNQQLQALEQQLRAQNQQLKSSEQQLKAMNQQLAASNQQLTASEQQLRALNQQLAGNEKNLKSTVEEQSKLLEKFTRTEKIANVGSWEWEIEDDRVTWSDELFRIFGLDPAKGAVSYKDHPRIYTPESMEKLRKAVDQAVKKGKSYELDLEIKRGDGTKAICHAIGFARKGSAGKVTGLYGSFQDITRFRKLEQELSTRNIQLLASEQQLKAMNQQLAASNQQLTASEQQLRALNQQLEASNKQLTASEQQLKAVNQQLSSSNKQLLEKENQLEQVNKELSESGDFLNLTGEMAKVGGWSIDLDRNTVYWTRGTKKIHEVAEDYEPGLQEAIDFFHEEDRSHVEECVAKARLENKPYEFEARLVTPKGKIKWTRSIGKTVFKDGKCIRLYGSFQDITDQKKAETRLKKSLEKVQMLSQHMVDVREEERMNIARNLHDDLGQILTAMKMDLTWIKAHLTSEDRKIISRLGNTISITQRAIGSVQDITSELRTPIIDELGLYVALDHMVSKVQINAELKFSCQLPEKDNKIPEDLKIGIYRIIQEGVTNIVRHAKATEALLDIQENEDCLHILLQDNGVGIKPEQTESPTSFGIMGIRERVQRRNGTFKISALPKGGTSLNIELPLSPGG